METWFTGNIFKFILAALLASLLFTLGNALIFDRLLIVALIALAIVSFKINKNTFSILCIVVLELSFEELNWYILHIQNVIEIPLDSPILKLYCYGLCFLGCYIERDELIAKIITVIALIASAFELYWLFNEIEPKQLYWQILLCGQVLIVKHFLFIRSDFLYAKYPDCPDWTWSRLDMDYVIFLKLKLTLEAASIIEYLVRYVLDNSSIIFVYNVYPYIAHSINVYLLLVAVLETHKSYKQKVLAA